MRHYQRPEAPPPPNDPPPNEPPPPPPLHPPPPPPKPPKPPPPMYGPPPQPPPFQPLREIHPRRARRAMLAKTRMKTTMMTSGIQGGAPELSGSGMVSPRESLARLCTAFCKPSP